MFFWVNVFFPGALFGPFVSSLAVRFLGSVLFWSEKTVFSKYSLSFFGTNHHCMDLGHLHFRKGVFFLDYPVVSYADVSKYANPFEDDIYIYIYGLISCKSVNVCLQAFWFMWAAPIFLESLRELRFWASSSSSSIPWGFIILALLVSFGCGCCCGAALAIVSLSRGCRNLLLQLLGLIVELGSAGGPVAEHQLVGLRRRFNQYRA